MRLQCGLRSLPCRAAMLLNSTAASVPTRRPVPPRAQAGTPASEHRFTLRRVLARPTCHTTTAHIVRRNSLLTCVPWAQPGISQIALRVAVCIEARLLRQSRRWLQRYGPNRLPRCSSKCRAALPSHSVLLRASRSVCCGRRAGGYILTAQIAFRVA
jgi:hypothetical protein